jgi:hypothetical protein
VRYFDDKAVDPPKRKTRGEEIAQSLDEALIRLLKKMRNDRKDKTPDIHGPVHVSPDNGVCDKCGHGRNSDRHSRRDGRIGDEGTGE